MKLLNKTKNILICENLVVAKSLLQRMRGLLGKKGLASSEGLWLKPCNSIHTWFMNFKIDVIFVDKGLCVRALHEDVGPWKVLWPKFGFHSAFELSAGQLKKFQLEIGDQLDVVA